MPTNFGGIGRRWANLAAKLKARIEEKDNVRTEGEEEAEQSVPGDAIPETNALAHPTTKSMLEYVSGRWLDEDSLADTNSTYTRERIQAIIPQESNSIHARGDPSYEKRPAYNDAVQRINSVPNSRSGSPCYYLENGRLGPPKQRRKLKNQGHHYCCGNPTAEPEPGNVFPVTETVDPDWRLHALGRNFAGYWSLQDFSEQHLKDRLFYNAEIRTPGEHLHGSHRAAAQDLESLHMENSALKTSSAEANDRATQLEEYVGSLRKTIAQIEADIDVMRSELDAYGRGL